MNLIIKKFFCKISWHSFGYDLVEHDGYPDGETYIPSAIFDDIDNMKEDGAE